MQTDQSNKDLVALIFTMAFILAMLVGIKVYDQKTGQVGKVGADVFNAIVD